MSIQKKINSIFRKPLSILLISVPFLLFVTILTCLKVSDQGASAVLINGDYEVNPDERLITNTYFIYIFYIIPLLSLIGVLIYLVIDGFTLEL